MPTEGPGLSAFMRFILEPPDIGTTARRKTSTPIPPIQWVRDLQRSEMWDSASTFVRILAPVVVKPDTVSNIAFVNEGISPVTTKGRHPQIERTSQLNAVAMQPSLR